VEASTTFDSRNISAHVHPNYRLSIGIIIRKKAAQRNLPYERKFHTHDNEAAILKFLEIGMAWACWMYLPTNNVVPTTHVVPRPEVFQHEMKKEIRRKPSGCDISRWMRLTS